MSSYQLLTAEDLAERWQVTPRWLLAQARNGEIPKAPLPGRYVRFRLEDIEAFEQRASGSELPHSEKRGGAARTARPSAPGGWSRCKAILPGDGRTARATPTRSTAAGTGAGGSVITIS